MEIQLKFSSFKDFTRMLDQVSESLKKFKFNENFREFLFLDAKKWNLLQSLQS